MLTRYELIARAEGLSQKTIDHVKLGVKFFNEFLGGINDVRKVSPDDLRQFIVASQQKLKWAGTPQQSEQKISDTAINTYVRGIKSFWSWLDREGTIKDNPLAKVPAPKIPKRLPKVLTEEELTRVLKVANESDRDRAMVNLLLDSGIRLSELVGLTPDDVYEDTVKVFGKGRKERHVFISAETKTDISLYLQDERPEPVTDNQLFLTVGGYPLIQGRVQKILERMGKKAKISQRLSPHKLRHSYATLSLRHGANLEYVRRTLGHTNIKTTEVYLGLTDTDVAQAHKKFSPVTNLDVRNRRKQDTEERKTIEAIRKRQSII
ncbi:tyrosine-type recombinase/integrase [Chloroflexota bacterium]